MLECGKNVWRKIFGQRLEIEPRDLAYILARNNIADATREKMNENSVDHPLFGRLCGVEDEWFVGKKFEINADLFFCFTCRRFFERLVEAFDATTAELPKRCIAVLIEQDFPVFHDNRPGGNDDLVHGFCISLSIRCVKKATVRTLRRGEQNSAQHTYRRLIRKLFHWIVAAGMPGCATHNAPKCHPAAAKQSVFF